MSTKWSDDDMSLFLDLYKNHQCLWNTKENIYRNTQARSAALEAIIVDMGKPDLTVNDLKNKIKNIRSIYNRELTKVLKSEKSGAGTDDIYKPHLKWFDQANTFLRSVSQSRQSQSNMENSEFTQNEEADYFGNDGTSENTERSVENDTQNENLAIVNVQQTPKRIARVEGGVRQPKKIRTIEPIEKAINKLESIAQINNAKEASDEFDIYGKFIATQLRALPMTSALVCQEEFQRILTRERIKAIQYPTSSSPNIQYYNSPSVDSGSSHFPSPNYISSPSPNLIYSIPPSPKENLTNVDSNTITILSIPETTNNSYGQQNILQEAARIIYD